jgi:hypothetical protein
MVNILSLSSNSTKSILSNKFDDDKYFQINHPTDISHIEWGNHLNEYIQSNYNIPTKSFL